MSRTFTWIVLALLLTGCTRYGTNPPGKPFTPRPKSEPNAVVPPGPPVNNSPLALNSSVQPEPPQPPEPVALAGGFAAPKGSDVIPAGGFAPEATSLPPRRRRAEPQSNQLPSPFAPKDAPGANAPAPPPDATKNITEIKKLVDAASAKWAKTDTYEAIVTRRELAPNKKMNEDVVLYQFRKKPMAVYIRNLDEANQPREIIYTQSEDRIHSVVGKADATALFRAGSKAPAVTPDFPAVKEKTRYSIREAGYGTPIARVGTWVAKAESGKIPADALTYQGEVKRKEYPYPLVGVQLKLRPGDDPLLPNGGMRQWFFDPKPESDSYSWPVLIIATEPDGKEVEYYLFEKVKLHVPLTDADFDPARLGKKR